MKFTISAAVTSALFLQAYVLAAEIQKYQAGTLTQCGYTTVPLLRAYNAAETDHFYTTDALELENSLSQGYVSEGDAAEVLPSQVPNTIPLYRAFKGLGTDHFYTTSASELNTSVQNDGYAYEGITAYVYPTALCGTIPLYRMYNHATIDHFYTTNATERNVAIASDGYIDEGIAAYVSPGTNIAGEVQDDIIAALNLTFVG